MSDPVIHQHHDHREHGESHEQQPVIEPDAIAITTSQEIEAETAVVAVEVEDVPAAAAVADPEPAPETVPEAPVQTESQTVVSEIVNSPIETDLATSGPVEPEHKEDLAHEESLYSGLLAYRKASATFPIYHKRYFYFSSEAIPLENLYAFYEKSKKLKVDKDELDQLVARKRPPARNGMKLTELDAATSGVGLLFYSKAPDAAPSGILECSRMTEIKADEHMSDRFSISYGAKQTFYFETGLSNRAAWVAGISKKKFETTAEIETIRTSAIYIANLKVLEDGTAFHKIQPIEVTNEIFSDEDENEVAVQNPAAESAESSAEDKNSERPKGRRASSFLKSLKDKAHQEKPTAEVSQEGPEVPEKTPKKDKRRSFLAGFKSKRDTVIAPSVAESQSAPAQDLAVAHTEADATCSVVVEKQTSERAAAGIVGTAKSPLSPFKEKVDGFFSKFKKSHDKEQMEVSCNETETGHVHMTADSTQVEPADAQAETSGVTTEITVAESSAATEVDIGPCSEQCAVSQTVEAASAPVEDRKSTDWAQGAATTSRFDTDVEFEEKKSIGLARRLTSLFKAKKPGKQQVPASSVITSDGPPQLPETAIIDSEPEAEPTTVDVVDVTTEAGASSNAQEEITCCAHAHQTEATIIEEKEAAVVAEPVK
ncbi:putative Conserved lysine-rich protein [Taphrina deformans PYCC 5710]|uniref:Conserved lysine-rich protein n=1 Tax=Taphrina deformans (strain PYCC 5710 / ATCC 11124 / CBS 356.35 / IMI 108563 / JCM 9778 / NBRC 8474) TaxID=1097556 RepID=S0BE39_TAPDE|nr:putative Conserved lysine-rich protein [Taphrina deformans PYCC 5710]|eukprot:CCG81543.1 putative Conserved lysine-rich protein [Taphrina deformans PYCC 5710]